MNFAAIPSLMKNSIYRLQVELLDKFDDLIAKSYFQPQHYTTVSKQLFWQELFSCDKRLRIIDPFNHTYSLEFCHYRDFLIPSANRSSPIVISVFKDLNNSLIALVFVGEYFFPLLAITLIFNDEISFFTQSPDPHMLKRLFGDFTKLKRIASFLKYFLPLNPVKSKNTIFFGLTKSIGHFIQEEMSCINNIYTLYEFGYDPNVSYIHSHTFGTRALFLDKQHLDVTYFPSRLDSMSYSFQSPIRYIPASSNIIFPLAQSTSKSYHLLHPSGLTIQPQLHKYSNHRKIIFGIRVHERLGIHSKLDSNIIKTFAHHYNSYFCHQELPHIEFAFDFHTFDFDSSLLDTSSQSSVALLEKNIWDSLSHSDLPSNISLTSLLGFTMQQKINYMTDANVGIYPFGSGWCLMAHLTSVPLIEYRPEQHHSERILLFEQQLMERTFDVKSNLLRANYDNILFLDHKGFTNDFDNNHYWFIPSSVAHLVYLLTENISSISDLRYNQRNASRTEMFS
ncbi:hypothetical protein [Prochlorococcus marinus]|uniref:hypothetical protein n=1 Tax=Prochlorococcus marinus TaxID=1219 RepID=UPI0012DA5FB3|nr:hypothetical protein [Prochlorococcus marinus]